MVEFMNLLFTIRCEYIMMFLHFLYDRFYTGWFGPTFFLFSTWWFKLLIAISDFWRSLSVKNLFRDFCAFVVGFTEIALIRFQWDYRIVLSYAQSLSLSLWFFTYLILWCLWWILSLLNWLCYLIIHTDCSDVVLDCCRLGYWLLRWFS